MLSFIIALVALVLGYFIYGNIVERVASPSDRPTPAYSMADGVDYIAMPTWRVFMIQFLNIAGTGPIFGAIMGAWYGPSAYLWIVFGCIFAGATHDYLSGMLSIRHKGANLPTLVGIYLGPWARRAILFFAVFLLLMVGVVFVYSPALLLKHYCLSEFWWVLIIFGYYILATILPIDKIIGRIYPLFAISLLFMALALMVVLFIKMPDLPEWWSNLDLANKNTPTYILGTQSYFDSNPLFPCLFLTIACGAISGFHATQSPLMARCIKSERLARPVFYGSMITEGVVALIWATVSSYFFYNGGWREVVDEPTINAFLGQATATDGKTLLQYFTAPNVVNYVCTGWLGIIGGLLAILGVVAAPITSGDTAFRSARLIIAEALHMEQKQLAKRFLIALPLFAVGLALLIWQIDNKDGFQTIWQWFGWSNQTLAVFTLWTITVYLTQKEKCYWITLLPAIFMTMVCSTYIFISKTTLHLCPETSYLLGGITTAVVTMAYTIWFKRQKKNRKQLIK